MVRRDSGELGEGREGERAGGVTPDDGDVFARRDGLEPLAKSVEDILGRTGLLDLPQEVAGPDPIAREVHVGIDETGNDGAAGEVDDARVLWDRDRIADRADPRVLDQQRRGLGVRRIDGEDHSVDQGDCG